MILSLAKQLPDGIRRMASGVMSSSSEARLRRLGTAFGHRPDLGLAYWAVRGIFTPLEVLELAKHYLPGDSVPNIDQLLASLSWTSTLGLDVKDGVGALEISRYLRNQLLRDSDICSMAASVELRTPFVDRRLFDTIAAIPARRRLADGKAILRAAVPELPEWVLNRRKTGFTTPVYEWFKLCWPQEASRLDQDSPVPLQPSARPWALFNLDQAISRLGITLPQHQI
jgi:asparagine synthase (glutamine-hydrolysing)